MWSILGIFAILGWLAVTISERRHRAVVPVTAATIRLPLRNKTAWLVALFFACDNFLFYALLSWTSPMYRELGLSASTAGLVLASFTAVFMLANPVFGYVSRSQDRRVWLAICGVLSVAGLVVVAIAPTLAPFLFIPLAAFGLGGGFTLGMTLPLDNTRSVEEANVWNPFVLTVGYLIASTGPLLVGRLRDVSGDFKPGIWLCAGVATVMLLLTPFLRPAPTAR
jgi:MFS transporter, CP family, cyanate transporter